ncbi:phage holin family protein [Rhodosalinus halophilus]|uniref:Phage holin family protein n=1 Tax=Rhodosalinus halophilus TaxID=2259333 RepID=A0A365UB34_9RHOB|nr:phage holin family protein [Rhodosalinus halophilus]RBI86359.1 phage holin family protein [Rhodosalinus halophilus]
MSEQEPPRRSAAALLVQAFDQARGLLRRELDLARAEADRSLRSAGAALGLLAVALLLAITALDVLAEAAVLALERSGLTPGWAAVLVGGALALVALVVAWRGLRDLDRARLAPERVGESLREDARRVKEAADAGH